MSMAKPDRGQESVAQIRSAERLRIFAAIFFFMMASAVPMSFFYYVFPPILRLLGHSPQVVGAFALVYLPYVLRGLWAFAIERALGGAPRHWRGASLGLALAAVAGVLALLALDPGRDLVAIMAVAVMIFAVLASGMTALDGYVLKVLGPEGRARAPAWGAAGVAVGGILVGGLAWMGWIGSDWPRAVWVLAAMTAVPAVLVAVLPGQPGREVGADLSHPQSAAARAPLWRSLWSEPALRNLLLVSLLAHGAMGLVSGYLPILQVDSGLTLGEIGLFSAVAANSLGLLGAVAGGIIVARIGGWKSLAGVTFALALCLALAAALHGVFWGRLYAILLTTAAMLVGYVYYVPYRALSLLSCTGPHAVAQAALLSSFDMTVGILCMSLAGVAVTGLGFVPFLCLCAVAALLAAVSSLRRGLPRAAMPQTP